MKDNNIDKLFREKLEQLSDLPENIIWNKESGWLQYQKQYNKEKPKIKEISITLLSVAAVIVIVLYTPVLNPFSKRKTVVKQNNTSEVSQINLPDGNKVWLNSNSSIEYFSEAKSGNFEAIIQGEVYIEINNMQHKQYILKAFNATVIAEKVASINIKAYPYKENIDINVNTGAIKVFEEGSRNGLALLVTQGNYCSVHKSQKLIYAATNNNDNYLAWKTGSLIFEDQSIATVVDILSEYFNRPIEITSESIAYCTFSGTFEKPALEIILNKIQKDLNLNVNYTGTKITISGIGCL
jgi:ferric-dicitrate binding protein FerR (iron transport regulator)